MIGDVLHVIDEVEEDDVSQEEMFCEEEMGLVDDELNVIDEEIEVEEDDDSHEGVADEEVLVNGVLAVRIGMTKVSYAAVHKGLPWCHHDDEDNVVDEEFEVEEEDVFHEEMTDEEDDVQHGVLAMRTGLSTVNHAAVNKVHDALAVMTREFMVIRAAVYKVCTADPQLSLALRVVQTGRCHAADGGRRERTLWQQRWRKLTEPNEQLTSPKYPKLSLKTKQDRILNEGVKDPCTPPTPTPPHNAMNVIKHSPSLAT